MKRAAPFLLFAAVTLAVFWKFVLFGHTMYAIAALEHQLGMKPQEPSGWFVSADRHSRVSDNVVLLENHLRVYNQGLKAGELRLWNPSLLCGIPLYADPMVHPFYPPHLALHAVFPTNVAYELNLLLHLFFSGAAMYALLRGQGRSSPAATVGGLVWMLFGYQAVWFSTGILAGVTVFGPLALLALGKGIEKRDRSWAPLAALAMGLAILGSHPQHALLTFFFLLAWIGHQAWLKADARRFIAGFAGMFVLLSVGVGLADILTRLDTLENGYRDPAFDQITLYAEPGRLATYGVGLILGKVYFPSALWEFEFPVFAGLTAASLAVAGALRGWKEPRVRFVAIAALLSFGVAFFYPLAWVFLRIPILNLSPASRCLFITGLCLAWLAAEGWDALAARLGRFPFGVAWVTVAFVAAMLLGVDPIKLSNGAAIETALGFALATGAAFAVRRWPRPGVALALAALLFELLPPFIQYNWHSDSSLLDRPPKAVAALPELGPPTWRATGILGTSARSTKAEQWGNDLVVGNNLLARYGVNTIGGFEAIIPAHVVTWGLAAGGNLSPAGRTLQFTHLDSPLLDAAALKYALLPPALPLPSRYRKQEDFGSVSLFENREALPRARLVRGVRLAGSPADAEKAIRDPGFDPRVQVVVETDGALRSGGVGTVEWVSSAWDRFLLEVTASSDALLFLADADYPGWEATVDGAPTRIYRADVAFRAVEVPTGTHRVEFRFRPESARNGLLGSISFSLVSVGLWAFLRFRRPA